MFGSLGVPELLLIFVVILIVFGPRRIPEIGRTLGKALGEFRKATDDLKSTIEREVRLEELKKVAPAIATPLDSISRSEPLDAPHETSSRRGFESSRSDAAAEISPLADPASSAPTRTSDESTSPLDHSATRRPGDSDVGDSNPASQSDESKTR